MAIHTVSALDSTVHLTHEWLLDLEELGHFEDEGQAYSALRAVLQALRDQLTIDEGAHLSSQLPMLIRGIYYEGWHPAGSPSKIRSSAEFLQRVNNNMSGGTNIDPNKAVSGVFILLNHKIQGGELNDIKNMLPPEIRNLWPKQQT